MEMAVDLLNLPGLNPVDLTPDGGRLVITAHVVGRELSKCPKCGSDLYRHGKHENFYADTPIQMRPVRLKVVRPRFRCRTCKATSLPEIEGIDDSRLATKRLVDSIKEVCLRKTFTSVAEDSGLALNTVKNITLDRIAELERSVQYETPVVLGIDEVHLGGKYRCIMTNLTKRQVYQMLELRTQSHLKAFFKTMPDKEKVEWVCTDMWRPFKISYQDFLPNAKLVIDRFHVVDAVNKALEVERKRFQATLEKAPRLFVKKSLRWMFLKNPRKLTEREREELDALRSVAPDLAGAYDFKEWFRRIYEAETKEEAISIFKEWEGSLPVGEYAAFHKVAKTVNNHFDDIFAYWDAPFRITNGYTEALNGLAKMANRLGRGYSFEIIRARILYGNLSGGEKLVSTNDVLGLSKYGAFVSTTG